MHIAPFGYSSRTLLRSCRAVLLLTLLVLFPVSIFAKVVVFWQPDFPPLPASRWSVPCWNAR